MWINGYNNFFTVPPPSICWWLFTRGYEVETFSPNHEYASSFESFVMDFNENYDKDNIIRSTRHAGRMFLTYGVESFHI